MLETIEFGRGKSVGNDSWFGAPNSWVWTSEGIGVSAAYDWGRPTSRDFFALIWQVNVAKEDQPDKPAWMRNVRLQLESARYNENATLNNLKRDVIRALLNSRLPRIVREKGYTYDNAGTRTSDEQIQKTKTTTLFSVVLPIDQMKLAPKKKIEIVYDAIGSSIDTVLQQFSERLNAQFGR